MCQFDEVAQYYAELEEEEQWSCPLPMTKDLNFEKVEPSPPAGEVVPQGEAESPTPTPKEK